MAPRSLSNEPSVVTLRAAPIVPSHTHGIIRDETRIQSAGTRP